VPFSLDGEGRVLASWMSRGRVYWAFSRDGGRSFGPRIPAPGGSDQENYPTVLANGRGEVLLVWKEASQVRWATYDREGRFTGRSGTAGELPAHDKPTAFVARDGRFAIVM
jgi:hypothetical protein